VLQPTWVDGIYRLWFKAQKSTGEKAQGWIFCHESSRAGMPAKMPDYPDGVNSIWKFSKRGHQLDCQPSVYWISWGFHNAGSWSTDYVEMTTLEKAKAGEADGEPPRYSRGSAVHHDLNFIDQTFIQQAELVAELKKFGTLL